MTESETGEAEAAKINPAVTATAAKKRNDLSCIFNFFINISDNFIIHGKQRQTERSRYGMLLTPVAEIGIVKENIISINFEDPEIDAFSDYRAAWKFIRSKFPASGKAYVFLDEIQLVPDFEKDGELDITILRRGSIHLHIIRAKPNS